MEAAGPGRGRGQGRAKANIQDNDVVTPGDQEQAEAQPQENAQDGLEQQPDKILGKVPKPIADLRVIMKYQEGQQVTPQDIAGLCHKE